MGILCLIIYNNLLAVVLSHVSMMVKVFMCMLICGEEIERNMENVRNSCDHK